MASEDAVELLDAMELLTDDELLDVDTDELNELEEITEDDIEPGLLDTAELENPVEELNADDGFELAALDISELDEEFIALDALVANELFDELVATET